MGSTSSDKAVRDAIEVFARGYCLTRSRTHPYLTDEVDGLWRMRDAERKNAKDYRREEWTAFKRDPKEVDRIVRAKTRGRFCICAFRGIDEPLEPLRDAYKAMGYRLGGTEPFFEHDLKKIPTLKSPATIERVLTGELAARLGKAWRMKPMQSELLVKEAPIRQYVAIIDDEVIGAVTSVATGKRNWVSGLLVREAHRRKGVGKALMAQMLRDDRAFGSRGSVLLASHTGAKLYPLVGYAQIGELLLFTPKRP
jgi:GNAT superfamily N-acetyltransferase